MAVAETRRVRTDDGVELHCELTGSGHPLIFVHEYGGDCRSWQPQVDFFFQVATAVSPSMRAVIRLPTFPRSLKPIRRNVPGRISAMSCRD